MSSFVNGIESVLPKSLNYKELKKSILKGTRKTVRLFPSTNVNSFSPNGNRVIEFQIPANGGFLDMKNTTICFEAFADNGGGDTDHLAFNNFIECIINKVQWFTGDGANSVELITDYNVLATSDMYYKYSNNYYNTIGRAQQGINSDTATRVQWANAILPNPQGYCINLISSGVMNCVLQYLPLSLLAQDGYNRSLTLQLTLEVPERCMIDSTSGTQVRGYQVQNVFMQMELIDCPKYEKELKDKIMKGESIGIPFSTVEHFTSFITQNRQGEMTFPVLSYHGITQGFRNIFIVSPASTGTEYTSTYIKPAGMQYYQLNVGNKFYPIQLVNIGPNSNSVQINELLKYFNKLKDYDNGLSVTQNPVNDNQNIEGNKYMIAETFKTWYDCENWMLNQNEYFLDGIDTDQSNQIVLKMSKYNQNGDSNVYNLFMYVDYVGALVIDKNGVSILK